MHIGLIFLIYYVSLCLLLAVFRPFIYLKWLLIFVIFPNHYMSLCSFPFILLLLMVLIEHCRSFYSSPFQLINYTGKLFSVVPKSLQYTFTSSFSSLANDLLLLQEQCRAPERAADSLTPERSLSPWQLSLFCDRCWELGMQ